MTAELELAYAPALGAAKDPVNLAGMIAQNILAGDINVIQWHEIADLAPHKRVILDVRDNTERQQGYIPGSVHIPLPQLRSRLSELPRDGEIIPYCRSGQRSYDACRILSPWVRSAPSDRLLPDVAHRDTARSWGAAPKEVS